MSTDPSFRPDLYRGTARFYDEFRPAYPQPLFDDLRERARITGDGRLLDLACGTGQISFGLASDFVCNSPWDGGLEWQRVMADTVRNWTSEAGVTDRVPTNLAQHLAEEPHGTVLATAGYTIIGEFGFPTPYEWSVEQLTGFMYSTSILSRPALGPRCEAFEGDLRKRLLAVEAEGVFRERIAFSYTLMRSP